MLNYLGPDLDELLPHGRKGPLLDRCRKTESADEISQVVGKREKLEPNFVILEIMAGQPRPVDGVLSFFYP